MNDETRRLYESLGPDGVLAEIATGKFGPGPTPAKLEAEAWVNAERSRFETSASARREAREDETLSIARMALETSRSARTIAIIAMILAAILAAVQAKDQMCWLLSKFGITIP